MDGQRLRRSAEKSFDYPSSRTFFKTVLKFVVICWDAENNGTTQCSWNDTAYDRRQRWTSLGPLAFTTMFSASQLDNTITGSQGQRDLPFRIVDKKVREPVIPISNVFRDRPVNYIWNVRTLALEDITRWQNVPTTKQVTQEQLRSRSKYSRH